MPISANNSCFRVSNKLDACATDRRGYTYKGQLIEINTFDKTILLLDSSSLEIYGSPRYFLIHTLDLVYLSIFDCEKRPGCKYMFKGLLPSHSFSLLEESVSASMYSHSTPNCPSVSPAYFPNDEQTASSSISAFHAVPHYPAESVAAADWSYQQCAKTSAWLSQGNPPPPLRQQQQPITMPVYQSGHCSCQPQSMSTAGWPLDSSSSSSGLGDSLHQLSVSPSVSPLSYHSSMGVGAELTPIGRLHVDEEQEEHEQGPLDRRAQFCCSFVESRLGGGGGCGGGLHSTAHPFYQEV